MEWSDLVYAMALARHGTLSAAARELRVNHVTVARRVRRLEERLGLPLFLKQADGYRPTGAGKRVCAEGKAIEVRLHQLQLGLVAHAAPTSGPVLVSALEGFFHEVLIDELADFGARHPDIEVRMDSSPGYVDLARGSAHIAVRSPRPKQPNLICRRAFRVGNALYAARRYVDRHGLPGDLKHATGHRVVRYRTDYAWVPEEKLLDRHVRGTVVAARASSMQQQLHLVRAGVGIGFIECIAGDRDPELIRVPGTPLRRRTHWYAVHEGAYRLPRVRVVLSWLEEVAARVASETEG